MTRPAECQEIAGYKRIIICFDFILDYKQSNFIAFTNKIKYDIRASINEPLFSFTWLYFLLWKIREIFSGFSGTFYVKKECGY